MNAHHEIIRPGPLHLSTSNLFTVLHGRSKPLREKSVKRRDEERKRGALKMCCLFSSLLLFFSFQQHRSKVESREEMVVVNITWELSGPLSQIPFSFPSPDPLNVPISSFWVHRFDSPSPAQRSMSQTKGFIYPFLSACMIKTGTDQILPVPHTKNVGREQGVR